MGKPNFAAAKKPPGLSADAAAYVESGHGKDKRPKEGRPPKLEGPTRRINADVPLDLAVRFKAVCALSRLEMADEIRDFIEKRTAELDAQIRKAS